MKLILPKIQLSHEEQRPLWETISAWKREAVVKQKITTEANTPRKRRKEAAELPLLVWAWRKMERAAKKAQEKILMAHMPIVEKFVLRYRGAHIDHDELRQVGMYAITKAMDSFDYNKGKFSQYAGRWAFKDIKRHMESMSNALVIPETSRDAFSSFSTSLDTPTEGEREGLHAVLAAPEEVRDPILKHRIEEALASLEPREASAFMMAHGLQDGTFYTLEQIGEVFACSHEWARKMIKQARNRLMLLLRIPSQEAFA